ncbi:hypothetical protein SO802_019801 [Lithocarpus litseifolius]|uniref:Uncharacterized protein n=1 Tax=Lithocarpus litseifolius TaxID=425828 RepID=A0AAW2CQV4_9ROSI
MKNRIGNTALHEAVIAHVHHSKEAADYLLLVNPEAFYSLNDEGKSPFFLAVETRKINICLAKLLLQKTRNNDLVERARGELPVYAAIFKKRRDILQLIFEERPRFFNIRDKKGKTPLHFAASTGYFEGIRFLLETVKQSALERSKRGHVKIVELLEKQWGEPTELLNKEGQNILQVAAKSGRNNVVKHLLKTSQSNYWNAKDKGGNTALHLASMNLHPDVILSLTSDSRVDVKLRNGKGWTAFDIAGQRVRNLPFRKEQEKSPPAKKDKQENSQSENKDKQEAESQPENKDKQEVESSRASNIVTWEDSRSTKHCSHSASACLFKE